MRWVFVLLLLVVGCVFAQQNLSTEYRVTGKSVLASLEPQREEIQRIGAVFYEGRREVGYGVVVHPEGYILAKLSEIPEAEGIEVRIDRELFREVALVGEDREWDVGLYKVDGEALAVPRYAESGEVERGSVVIVNGATSRTKRRILAGIVSAKAREVPPDGGAVLGVQLDSGEGDLRIGSVTEGGGAEEAGLREGDLIRKIDGETVQSLDEISDFLEEKKAGGEVELTVLRDGEEIEVMVRLSARGETFEEVDRNDQMSGNFSRRRSGFPRVIQHDILGNGATMGGPVLNLEGELVGMNIARANRAETFAIPVEEVRKIAGRMIGEAGGASAE